MMMMRAAGPCSRLSDMRWRKARRVRARMSLAYIDRLVTFVVDVDNLVLRAAYVASIIVNVHKELTAEPP